ncbi:MAG: ubiquinol-cytochrome c reductase iron-sulfur subunit [Nitrospiraceae bacterium]|nr:MAG: ubiquinol-cytochrome c reductase iron-sulfur subunit [Nitrospiraceae bacterium]
MKENNYSRRSFLRIVGWGSFFATLGISSVGFIRFLYPNVLFEKPSAFKAGTLDEFTIDRTSDYQVYENWKAEHSIWIVREKDRIYAVKARCTHLGCTPNYFADEMVFKCPCHGSQFHCNGENFAGPAPRPLDRCKIFVGFDGRIQVDKARIYSFKEFDNPGAYVKV